MNVKMRLVTTGLVAMVAAGTWTLVQAQGGPARATIVLTELDGGCGDTVVGNDTDPENRDRIRSQRGRRIQWRVINDCDASADVSLTDWVRKADGIAATPGNPNGSLACTVMSGDQCILTLVVRGDAETTTYSYTVSVNGLDHDPDVIIDP